MKKLGIIGGLGPLASVCFYEMLTKMQIIQREQDYLDLLLYSISSTPDRTAYITGVDSAEDPSPSLLHAGKVLISAGAEVLTIPCVTAHFFYEAVASQLSVPVLHIVKETARVLMSHGFIKVGLLATNGTIQGRLFHETLEKQGIQVLVLSPAGQASLMRLIYQHVKQGKSADITAFEALAEELRAQGAETVILGCTELSILAKDFSLNLGYTDALACLARAALTHCGIRDIK